MTSRYRYVFPECLPVREVEVTASKPRPGLPGTTSTVVYVVYFREFLRSITSFKVHQITQKCICI